MTHIPDPTPEVRGIKQRLVKYTRKDGTPLSFTLLTPPGYKEGTRIPAILYAYPLDYASASTAGQISGSEREFMRIANYRLLLLSGYAIIDNAAFPIVGDPKQAYDTYLDQLVEDARAAVDTAVGTGVVDRDRIGVTGHSHGALMTANLIAHTDLFRAGVATSGSYNKTLTPFGFQNERRSVWKGQGVYLEVSPFFFADKIKLPLLIMHGTDDANPGTTPLQSVKLYEAIRGNGGTARLVMLPSRAALVRGDGIERAARVRGAALVRHVRQERARPARRPRRRRRRPRRRLSVRPRARPRRTRPPQEAPARLRQTRAAFLSPTISQARAAASSDLRPGTCEVILDRRFLKSAVRPALA